MMNYQLVFAKLSWFLFLESYSKVLLPVSKFSEELFETNIAGMNIFDLVYKDLDPKSELLSRTKSALSLVFGEDDLQWYLSQENLPRNVSLKLANTTKSLRVNYSPIWNNNNELEKLMYVIEDITDVLELEKKMRAEKVETEKNFELFQELSKSNIKQVNAFLKDSHKLISQIQLLLKSPNYDKALYNNINRNLHTIKGNARSFGLNRISSIVHRIETDLIVLQKQTSEQPTDSEKLNFYTTTNGFIAELSNLLEEYSIFINKVMGAVNDSLGSSDAFEVYRENFEKFQSVLNRNLLSKTDPAAQEILECFEHLLDIPAEVIFNQNANMIKGLSEELNKQIDFQMNCHGVMMSRKKLESINNGIGHLLRNALDHAIETPELRISKGKVPVGKIIFELNSTQDQIIISLSDDGKGIDPEFIANKAVEKGFIQQTEVDRMSDEEKLNLIFIPGFSSKENTSHISGRGVGMDVVHSMIKDWNGIMTVNSTINVGTQINITLNKEMKFNNKSLEKAG